MGGPFNLPGVGNKTFATPTLVNSNITNGTQFTSGLSKFLNSNLGGQVIGGIGAILQGGDAKQVVTSGIMQGAQHFATKYIGSAAIKTLTSKLTGMLGAKIAAFAASGLVSFGISTAIGFAAPYIYKGVKKLWGGIKSIFGFSTLRKAKKSFNKAKVEIEKQLIAQGMNPAEAKKAAANFAFQNLPDNQKQALLKKAQSNPTGESANIMREAGVDKDPNYTYTSPSNYQIPAFTYDLFVSGANTQERANANAEFIEINKKYGVVNQESLKKHFSENFTFIQNGTATVPATNDQWQAALLQKGYAVSVELVNEKYKNQPNMTMAEKISAYIISDADQSSSYNPATLRMEKNGTLALEEFTDIFDVPDRSSFTDIVNGQPVLDAEADKDIPDLLDVMDNLNKATENGGTVSNNLAGQSSPTLSSSLGSGFFKDYKMPSIPLLSSVSLLLHTYEQQALSMTDGPAKTAKLEQIAKIKASYA